MKSRPLLCLTAGLLLLGGCSTFERDWQAAATDLNAADQLIGRWQGSWHSEKTGHEGKLRCIISPAPDGAYNARYHAVWAKVLTFEYIVPFTATREGPVHKLAGEADLGFFAGGAYQYDATVTGDDFHATYRCKADHGEFRMKRVTSALRSP